MSLEEEINQTEFRNAYQKAVINLVYTHGWLDAQLKSFFEPYELTRQQFNILRILRGAAQPLSTIDIRKRMLDKMSDTSRIVDRMIEKELVQKCLKSADKRRIDVTITAKGKKLLQKIDPRQDELDRICNGLTDEEAEQLSNLLDKLRG